MPIGENPTGDLDKENVEGPEYLNESFGHSPFKDVDLSRAVARKGSKKCTGDGNGGFWGGLSSFLTNSFYW